MKVIKLILFKEYTKLKLVGIGVVGVDCVLLLLSLV